MKQATSAIDARRWAFFGSVSAVTLLVLVAKVLGFFEKVVLAYFEGASASMDAYVTAVSLAFFLYVLVDDILAPVFVSVYVTTRQNEGDGAARMLLQQVFAGTFVVLAVAVVGMEFFADGCLTLVAPGFDAARRTQTVGLLRWTLPGGFFLGLAGLTYVVLNAHRHFAWPEFSKVIYKAAILIGVVLLLPSLGIVAAAIAMCVAAIVQFALQVFGIQRWAKVYATLPSGGNTGTPVKRLLWLMVPLAIGTIAAQVSGFVDNNRGSTLAPGSLAALGYARKLVDLPVLLFPAVLGIVALPRFAELAAQGRFLHLMAFLARLTEFCLILFLPAMLILVLEPSPIIDVVFARGRFDEQAVGLTSRALSFFSIGLVAYAVEILILRAYYATLDTATPIAVGLVFVGVNIAMTVGLTPILGIAAIPIALSTQKILKVVTLFFIIARRYPGRWLTDLGRSAWRIVLCGAAFYLAFKSVEAAIPRIAGPRHVEGPLLLMAAALAASVVYGLGLWATGVVDVRRLLSELRARLAKKNDTHSS